jgi:hypothetical protein
MAIKPTWICFLPAVVLIVLTTSAFSASCPQADLDGDCRVDIYDLQIFAQQWLEIVECSGPGCADFDDTSRVDAADFAIFADNWLVDQREFPLVISEFMAINDSNFSTIYQPGGQREYPDWIEIHNPNDVAVSLNGLFLTDDANEPTKWPFPAGITIDANGYLIVCATNLDFRDPCGYYHTNFKLDGGGEYLALVAPDGQIIIHEYYPEFPPQVGNISYGLYQGQERYFATATPGAENNDGYLGLIEDPEFNHERGFYATDFNVTIACTTASATIRYTLNGDTPSETRGTVYTGPVHITTTTCLRAIAVKAGYKPSDVKTHTYIFTSGVINQSNDQTARGMPANWVREDGWSRPADYEMDPEIVTNPAYSGLMDECFKSIPTLSIVMDSNDLFDRYRGIYSNSSQRHNPPAEDWERACSAELFDVNGTENLQVNCAIRAHGDLSRSESATPKNPLRLLFKGDYGPGKLTYPFFKGSDVDGYNTIVLRAMFGASWLSDPCGDPGADYIRNRFSHGLLSASAGVAPEGRHVHLYLNGVYWGIYNPEERPDDDFSANHFGGDKDQWDVIKGGCVWVGTCDWQGVLQSGSKASYDAMMALVPKFSGPADPAHTISDAAYQQLCRYLDMEEFVDYMIANIYVHSWDWPQKNWYCTALRDPNNPAGPPIQKFRYFTWDMENCMGWHGIDRTTVGDSDGDRMGPGQIYKAIRLRPDFQRLFGDRLHKHFFNDGGLLTSKNSARYKPISDEIYTAIIGESARWGDYRKDYTNSKARIYTRNEHWLPEIDYLNGTGWYGSSFIGLRNDIIIGQFRNIGLYPAIAAPVFYINGSYKHGGYILSGDRLTASVPSGTIYYTLDGNDPLLANGQVNPDVNILGGALDVVLIPELATKKVLVPTGDIGTTWRGASEPYNDSNWNSATYVSGKTGGVGYDNAADYLPYISYDVHTPMDGINGTCYVRIPFNVNSGDLPNITGLTLKVRYDDGFVAYINGTRVAHINDPNNPQWNSEGTAGHNDSEAMVFQNFDATGYISSLHSGSNILAIHGLNAPKTSSDFLISVELHAVIPTAFVNLTRTTPVKARAYKSDTNDWSALNEAVYVVGPVVSNLRITELMYHPLDTGNPDAPNTKYVELKNIGASAINLNLVKFTKGIDFMFPALSLASGGHILVVKNRAAFEAKYGTGYNIAGEYSGSLDNAGERIQLKDALGGTILDFDYKDGWRPITDGAGYSLTTINPANPDPNSWSKKESWRSSAYIDGSPGWDDSGIIPNPGSIVINEIMSHSHANAPDWIELYNTTGSSINIAGWFLSDSDSNIMKYEFKSGTTIGPYGYVLIYEDVNFGPDANYDPGRHIPFALSENGDTVCLSSGFDANGLLTGYRTTEDFGASATGVSFGRYYKASTSSYNFVPMDHNTPRAANAYPKISPIIITEIMYHPDWPTTGSYSNDEYEYIELNNITASPVTLYDSSVNLPWKFTDGIDYTFPSPPNTVTIPAGGKILVVKNPAAFSQRYPSVPSNKIFGPYTGWLANDGEQLQLGQPGDIDEFGTRQYIRVERIDYGDGSHPGGEPGDVDLWPTQADGYGKSLSRTDPNAYGNDPNNFSAATPSPES